MRLKIDNYQNLLQTIQNQNGCCCGILINCHYFFLLLKLPFFIFVVLKFDCQQFEYGAFGFSLRNFSNFA